MQDNLLEIVLVTLKDSFLVVIVPVVLLIV
jgi:hypothetical protein